MSLLALRQEETKYCIEHPEYFIDKYGHIEDKDADELIQPFKMWKEQRDALNSMLSHKLNIVLKARQLGLSWLVMHISAWYMIQEGKTVIGLSKTEEEAKELVRRLGVILRYMPELIAEKDFVPEGYEGPIFKLTALSVTVSFQW